MLMVDNADERTKKTISHYNRHARAYADVILPLHPSLEAKKFSNLLSHGARILDAGCAAGRDALVFTKMHFHVVGVDASEELLSIARQRCPTVEFIHGDIRLLSFPDNSFDGVWACAVIHHLDLQDMPSALGEFFRVLKPGGVLFISTRYGSGTRKIKDALSLGDAREFTHLTIRKLGGMVEKIGFKKIDARVVNDRDRFPDGKDIEWIAAFYRKPVA